jgi:hypothetical protein
VLNLLIALLSAEHAEVYEDIDKEFAFTQTKATLRMQERVDNHELPPPLNLLQLPTTLWGALRSQSSSSGHQRVGWLCWSVLALPVVNALSIVAVVLWCVAMAVQAREMPFYKRGDRFPAPLIDKLNPQGRWFRLWFGLGMGVFYPLLWVVIVPPLVMLTLPWLPCRILFCMKLKCLTFEVSFSHSPTVSCFIQ